MNADSGNQRDPETFAIIGDAMEVHSQLGQGFLEAVYQEALTLELQVRQIPFQREVPLPVKYKQWVLKCGYRADFICFGGILVEIKSIDRLTHIDMAQVINYLRATGLTRASLFNFGRDRLEFERIVLNHQ